jgi:hypothetical protein
VDLAVDLLAVHRATRLVTTDQITSGVRQRVWRRFGSEAGIGYAVGCEYCASVYVALAITATHLMPARVRPALRAGVYALAIADAARIGADLRARRAAPATHSTATPDTQVPEWFLSAVTT